MKQLFDPETVLLYLPKLLMKLPVTLAIVGMATLLGLILGVALALLRLYKIPVFNQLSVVYISFMRGTPIIVQMFLVFFGLPVLVSFFGVDINRWDTLFFVIVTYGLNAAAFFGEIFRSAIASVPPGQYEAAYSVGLTRLQAFRRVVAPQAAIIALPNFGTSLAGLLQDTSLAFTLGLIDVMGQVKAIASNTNRMLEGYVGAAFIFLVLSILLERGFHLIESGFRAKRHV